MVVEHQLLVARHLLHPQIVEAAVVQVHFLQLTVQVVQEVQALLLSDIIQKA
jgi:hypothetical protein